MIETCPECGKSFKLNLDEIHKRIHEMEAAERIRKEMEHHSGWEGKSEEPYSSPEPIIIKLEDNK